jgi:Uma2 family endonuclease
MVQEVPRVQDIQLQTTPATPRLRMTYEEFLCWAPESRQVEWVDGEVIEFMPPIEEHQYNSLLLGTLLQLYARHHQLGQVIIAPFEVRARSGGSAREPDIIFVAKDHLDRLDGKRLAGAADLLIELVSDDSVRRDRVDKFREYREAGVPEYWIIDPRPGKHRADFYELDPNGQYVPFATEDDPRVESRAVPGFWLNPEWLWQAGTLDPLPLFWEILGIPPEQIAQIQAILGGSPPPGE